MQVILLFPLMMLSARRSTHQQIHSRSRTVISILIATLRFVFDQFPGRYLMRNATWDDDWCLSRHVHRLIADAIKSLCVIDKGNALIASLDGSRLVYSYSPSYGGHRRCCSCGRMRCAEAPALISADVADSSRAAGEVNLSKHGLGRFSRASVRQNRSAAFRSHRLRSERHRPHRNLWMRLHCSVAEIEESNISINHNIDVCNCVSWHIRPPEKPQNYAIHPQSHRPT